MKRLNPKFDLESFFSQLQIAAQSALLLDYDGTLAPFQLQRDQAFPYPGVREMLSRLLHGGRTRIVIVSGRAIKDLIPILNLNKLPEIWGAHGMERLTAEGSYELTALPKEVVATLEAASAWAEEVGLAGNAESKPGCLAFHWRGLPDTKAREILDLVTETWSGKNGLRLIPFDGGVELRATAKNKGDAVATVLSEMHDDGVAAYLGDDQTDEDAFNAIKGRGAAVLVNPEVRQTAADLQIVPPGELLEFLQRWAAATGA